MDLPTAFEWDHAKAEANFAKHGVRFDFAVGIFLDEARLEQVDARQPYGEDRINVIGIVEDVVLQVTYTMRGDTARIISARRASRKERQRYGHHA